MNTPKVKKACIFCGQLYRSSIKETGKRFVDCHDCRVNLYWRDDQLVGIKYRLDHPKYKSVFMCTDINITYLHPAFGPSKKYPDIKLDGAWPETKPHEMAALISRLENLMVFS